MRQRRQDIYADGGSVFISDTNAHTGLSCIGFRALTDTEVASITYATNSDVPGIGAVTGAPTTVTAGCWVAGRFTAITLTSGDIQAVNDA